MDATLISELDNRKYYYLPEIKVDEWFYNQDSWSYEQTGYNPFYRVVIDQGAIKKAEYYPFIYNDIEIVIITW